MIESRHNPVGVMHFDQIENVAEVADLYLSDLIVREDTPPVVTQAFTALLSGFVRGRVTLHFAEADEARATLLGCGFRKASLEQPGGQPVRVIRAAR